MGEMRVLCVSLPNDVKYEFSYMCPEEACMRLVWRLLACTEDACQVSKRGLVPLAPMACGSVRQHVYCASWRVRTMLEPSGERMLTLWRLNTGSSVAIHMPNRIRMPLPAVCRRPSGATRSLT